MFGFSFVYLFLETDSPYVTQVDLKLIVILLQCPKCWDWNMYQHTWFLLYSLTKKIKYISHVYEVCIHCRMIKSSDVYMHYLQYLSFLWLQDLKSFF